MRHYRVIADCWFMLYVWQVLENTQANGIDAWRTLLWAWPVDTETYRVKDDKVPWMALFPTADSDWIALTSATFYQLQIDTSRSFASLAGRR